MQHDESSMGDGSRTREHARVDYPAPPTWGGPWRRSSPSARRCRRWGAVVLLAAGLLAGGAPAAAGPDHSGRSPWSGLGGDIPLPAAQRAATAATGRLAPAARLYAEAAWSESLALATAALAAARAVDPGTTDRPPGTVSPLLGAAVGRLTVLLGPAEGRVRAPADAALGAAVARAAGEVLRYAMEVESAAEASAREAVAVRTDRLAGLEQAAHAAAQAAAVVLVDVEPLTPSPDAATLTADAASTTGPGVGPTGPRARLRPAAPDGVAELVRRWSNGMIPAEALCPVPFAAGHLLQCDAAAALSSVNDAYRAHFGVDLDVVSSYRSLDAQVTLRATRGGLAAVPGTSNHGWGLAVDLGGIGGLGEFDAPGYRWLQEHAGTFGWHHPRAMEPGGRGPEEPWHWEFATSDP